VKDRRDLVALSSSSVAPVDKTDIEKKCESSVGKGELITAVKGMSKKVQNNPFFYANRKNELLRKTELCVYWMRSSTCTYKTKCHFAHGNKELMSRVRQGNFKTQPCLAFDKCRYASRCSYCHPGEGLRRMVRSAYFDVDYFNELQEDFGENQYPFGIYI